MKTKVQHLNISHIYLMETIRKLSATIQQIEYNTTLSIYNDKYRTYLRHMAGQVRFNSSTEITVNKIEKAANTVLRLTTIFLIYT